MIRLDLHPVKGALSVMVIAAEYPLLNIFWTMAIFFVWVIWIWMLVGILTDVFRRSDLSGWGKAGWTLFLIVLPYIGVFTYLVTQHDGMTERSVKQAQGQQQQLDEYVRSVAGNGSGPASEIEKARKLLDSGAINQGEYESIKVKALA
jgi:hypothetical protein